MVIAADSYVLVGKIGAAHGIKGWVKITSHTSSPVDIFSYSPWYLRPSGAANREDQDNTWQEASFSDQKQQDKYLVARVNNSQNRSSAQKLTNFEIAVKRDQLPEISGDEHYWSDLENLTVKTVTGIVLGKVDHLFETGANDVMVVIDKENNKRRLLPFTREQVVKNINIENKVITVDWDPEF